MPAARDRWRDLSGDARTTRQAVELGEHAQCSLATIRNLFRDQSFSAEELAASCVGQEYDGDIRFPDWPKVMQPLLREGEVVKSFNAALVDTSLLTDVRLAACILMHRTHVIAIVRDEARNAFRIYDNDSKHRQQGTFELREMRGMCMNVTLVAVMANDSNLSRALGGSGQTTGVTLRRSFRVLVRDALAGR